MAFTLEPIFELSRFSFHIPSYQRGYRWEKDQIVDLLDDLQDFIESKPDPHEYYSLQPIVVAPKDPNVQRLPKEEGKSELSKYPDGTEFIVIDGQQRLTTIFLLIEYLNLFTTFTRLPQYSLHFDQRKAQDDFLSKRTFKNPADNTYLNNIDNIDNFYVRKAWEAINDWFKILQQQGATGENIFNAMKTMLNKKEPGSDIDLRIIWYEFPLIKDPIKEFDNINYGSIRLTGTELVKAMLLASDDSDSHEIISRGHAWDRMEKALQDPLFWSMLKTSQNRQSIKSAQSEERLSHIEFILDIVADEINLELPRSDQRNRDLDKDDFDYNVINLYFKLRKAEGLRRRAVVTEVWDRIEDTFNRVRNWYDNPMWFHYIGLWRRIGDPKKTESSMLVKKIRELEVKVEKESLSKDDFMNSLRKEVGSVLEAIIRDRIMTKEEKEDGIHPLEAKKLNYEENPDALRKMLLCFNVMTLAGKSESEQVRFPFHLYDKYKVTSLEHIYPQHIEREEMTPSQIKKYLQTYMSLGINVTDPDALNKLLEDDEWDKKELSENFWNQLEPFVTQLENALSKKTSISKADLHSIANMALVDQPTNSALSNCYLHQKRERLKERNQARLKNLDDGTYLMPATELVFAKHYTPASKSTELRFWTKDDRDAYLDELKSVYNILTR